MHVFDIHQEYKNADVKVKQINVLDEYKVPLRSLELQDWITLVKPSDLVQLPILRMSLQLANALEEKRVCEIWLKCYLALVMYRNIQDSPVSKRAKIIGFLQDTDVDTSRYHSQYGNFQPNCEEAFISSLEEKINNKDFDSLQEK